MTESELDVLWQRALHEAVAAGEPFTRYRFAALVRAQVIEEAIVAIESAILRMLDPRQTASECLDAIRALKDQPGHSAAADAGASTAPLPEGEAATARELAAMFRQFTKSSHRWHDGRSVHIVAAEVLEHFAGTGADAGRLGQALNELAADFCAATDWRPQSLARAREVLAAASTGGDAGKRAANRPQRTVPTEWEDWSGAMDRQVAEREAAEASHMAEDAEALHMNLDNAAVPRADEGGAIYSLWGRVLRFAEMGAPSRKGADNVSPGSNVQAESASPSVLLIRGEK